MAVVALENPLSDEAGLISLQESRVSVYTGVQTNEQIDLDKGNSWGLVEPAPSANGNDVAPAYIQQSTPCDQTCRCLWRDSTTLENVLIKFWHVN